MKAWSVAVRTVCRHGEALCASFTLAATRTDAITQAVSEALQPHGDCGASVVGTCPHEIAAELLRAAAEQIEGAP